MQPTRRNPVLPLVGVALALALGAGILALLASEEARGGRAEGEHLTPDRDLLPERDPEAAEPAAPELAAPADADGEAAEMRSTGPALDAEASDVAVRVFDPDGKPLASARIAVFEGVRVLGQAETDANGRAQLPAGAAHGDVGVFADGLPLWIEPFDASSSREIRMPSGAVVAGFVRVDGRVPAEPLELILLTDAATGFTRLPGPARRALDLQLAPERRVRVTTAADGGFRISGLPEPWSGRLYWIANPDLRGDDSSSGSAHWIDLPAPRSDVLLELRSTVRVRARIVHPDGTPVEEPRLQVVDDLESILQMLVPKALRSSGGRPEALDAEKEPGVVVLELLRPLPARIAFQISDGGDLGLCPFELVRFPPTSGATWDLGDVVLPPPRELRVRVVDPDGVPIRSANVVPRGDLLRSWDGSAEVELGEELSTVRFCSDLRSIKVTADGFAPRTIGAPFDASRDLLVVLRPSAAVLVRLEVEPASSRKHLAVALLPVDGEPAWRKESADWRAQRGARVSAIGDTRFAPLESGVTHVLRVYDSGARVLYDQIVPPLEPGEERVVPVRFTWHPATVWLRVRDRDGVGVHGAEIRIDGVAVGRTDYTGETQLVLEPGSVDLAIVHADHGDLRFPAWSVPTDGEWNELLMPPR